MNRKILGTTAAVLAAGAVMPTVMAAPNADCYAADLAELESCLSDSSVVTIYSSEEIKITGEGVEKTLNTSGKTIAVADGKNFLLIENGAKVTLAGDGEITSGRYGAAVDGAELIIDGPTIHAVTDASYGIYAKNNGRVTINNGVVNADYAAFAGNNTTGDMNFYINGGVLHSNRYPAIYMPGQVDLVMRGGVLDGGIMARMGQIVIEDGTINAQDKTVVANVDDGLAKNYNGMASMYEAIALVGGSYKSANATYGNRMNVIISGGIINGEVALYDMGRTTAGYEQDINIEIEGGVLEAFTTKFTAEEIGFTPKSEYTPGLNDAAGRVNVDIKGGVYTAEPDASAIAAGHEAEYDGSAYTILPIEVDHSGRYFDGSTEDGDVYVGLILGKSLVADRKATLNVTKQSTKGLKMDTSKPLTNIYLALNIDLVDRSDDEIVVQDNDLRVWIEVDKETYEKLEGYDKVVAIYFDESGNEVERFDVELAKESLGGGNYIYYVMFDTPHLSTYAVAGVSDNGSGAAEVVPTDNSASETQGADSPDTGAMTREGSSALVASVAAAVVVGITTMIAGIAVVLRRFK